MIDLHYWPTPNGKKVTILLEELGMPYKIVPVNIGRGDQFSDAFLEMNPNHRMPVMVDTTPADNEKGGGGKPLVVFESGAIMMYLAEKGGKFYPQDLRTKHEVNEWLIWQMANQGPKSGECGHFRRVDQAKEGDQKYAITRFTDEVNRLYGVLNNRLYKHKYLAGEQYTIADMICYPWTINWKFQGQDLAEFPYFKRWFDELGARPAVVKGMAVGADLSVDREKLPPEEQERIRKIKRLSMMRIMASRTKATTVEAYRSKSRASLRLRLIQAKVRSTIQRLGMTTNLCSSVRLTISICQLPVSATTLAILGP